MSNLYYAVVDAKGKPVSRLQSTRERAVIDIDLFLDDDGYPGLGFDGYRVARLEVNEVADALFNPQPTETE